MNNNKLFVAISVFFLVVGIVVSYRQVGFSRYVEQTLKRDTAQENCQRDTIAVLRGWQLNRIAVEAAAAERDRLTLPAFEAWRNGNQPTPEQAQTVIDAINNAMDARSALRIQVLENPLPSCSLG